MQAAVVYDNGGPNTNNGYYIYGSQSTADDFTLSTNALIARVGFYFQNYDGITGWNQDIQYSFRSDNGGVPDVELVSGAGQNVSSVDSGQPWCCGGNAYLVTFDLVTPFAATAGTTYWLQLSGATGGDYAWWVTTAPNSTNIGYSLGSPTYEQFAFYLDDTAASTVPEPASFGVMGAGVALLAVARRRFVRAR